MPTTRERALEAALRACLAQFEPDQADYTDGENINRPAWLEATYSALALPPSPVAPVAAGEHTPGPWHIGAHKTTDAFIWGADTSRRGCVAQVNLIAPDDTKDEGMANARLIAAAPDMLAALQAVNTVFTDCGNGPPRGRHDWLDTVRDAIARATGREG